MGILKLGVLAVGVSLFGFALSGCADDPEPSGSVLCFDESQCPGHLVDCEHVNTTEQGACVIHCISDTDCGAGSACIVGDSMGLDASCFAVCSGSCGAGYTCFEYDPGRRACLPTSWL